MKKQRLFLLILAGFGVIFLGMIFLNTGNPIKTQVAVIPVRGAISPGAIEASPNNVRNQINKANDQGAQGFLFEINSPGGTVVASRQFERIISNVEKPTVCQFKDYATSGAYWAASSCDKIVTDPLTITGAVGVTASYLEYSELMDEYGVEYVELKEGKLKEMGSPYRNITDEEKRIFGEILNQTHTEFVTTVSENRNITGEELSKVSTGRIFTGKEAENLGLVDYLGGRPETKAIFEEHFNETVNFNEYKNEAGILEILLNSKSKKQIVENKIARSTEMELPKLYA